MMAVSVIHPITADEAMIDAANMAAPVTAEANASGRALMNRATMRNPRRARRAFGVLETVVTAAGWEVRCDRARLGEPIAEVGS